MSKLKDYVYYTSAINPNVVESIDEEGGGGHGTTTKLDVNFYDYDGTIVKAFTADDFASLAALPANPSHEGLTAQGWNWTLEDAKAYVTKYGKLDIGQMYITDDGATRLYIHIADEGRMDVPLSVTGGPTIDWGDGSAIETVPATTITHTYASVGDYTISLLPAEGRTIGLGFGNSIFNSTKKVYGNMLQQVNIGEGVTDIGNKAFADCFSLNSVTIPESVTSISAFAFQNCSSLKSVVIPKSVTYINAYTFEGCSSLNSVIIPNGVTRIDAFAFQNCHSLNSVTIPESITYIDAYVFKNCYSLKSMIIPESITVINAYTFQDCHLLSSVIIPESVTKIEVQAFQNCYLLSSVIIPNSVTYVSTSMFDGCTSLSSVVMPEGATSIGNRVFGDCISLSSIVIPKGVTSMGDAFSGCTSLSIVRFEATTPPTVPNADAFNDLPTDCKIYVPAASLEAYKAAENYPDPATYTYIGY